MQVLIVGAGHNGLVAATMLARHGLKVHVLEEKAMIGGATKTEYPFKKAPNLGTSTASYLLGVMPPEILTKLDANIRLIRRDPHYFLPTLDGRYLLLGSNKAQMYEQFKQFFSEDDFKANEALGLEIGQIRDDLAPSWLLDPYSVEETAEKFIRPHLRQVFIDLVTRPVEEYLARFNFKSELLMAMYAVTDGFSGLTGSFGTPATGMNFLVHNMCRLPGSDGTFMIAEGGMGSVAKEFARLAMLSGAKIETNAPVSQILVQNGQASGVVLKNGQELKADIVLVNADPFRLRKLVGHNQWPKPFNQKLDSLKRYGTTMKINLALDRLPTFSCLKENLGQHNGTIHLLRQGNNIIEEIKKGFNRVQNGEFDDFPTIEWYIHTQADPSLQDQEKRHNSAFFVQWVPFEPKNSSWQQEEDRYVKHLFSIAESFAPGFTKSVVDCSVLTPPKIEQEIGITYGHIHHIDNCFGFDKRMPYRTPIAGLYSCSAGCHPAGSVIGAAGHNAANRIIKDMGC